jgi:hypothetical protein
MNSQRLTLLKAGFNLMIALITLTVASASFSRTASAAPVTVTGTVRDGTSHGHTYPLYAKISFTSFGLITVTTFTNPFNGNYSVSLVQGAPYTATITPTLPGYPATSVTFTPTASPFTKDFTVQADLTVCSAPGYTNNKMFDETFDLVTPPALPPGWAVAKFGSATGNWTTASSSSHPSGIQPVSSPNLVVFNSYAATAGDAALLYTTTSTSIASLSTAVVSFWMYHDAGYSGSQDKVKVSVSTNGSTYYMVGPDFLRYSATAGWAFHQVDISSYAGPGKPSVYISLQGTSAYGNDIYIDDISISSATCLMSSGGMVSGFVSSSPSGNPIISALVANTARPEEQAYSMSRGEDPALQDGFYQLFSTVAGLQNFSATAIRHKWAEQIIDVANNSVTRLDLAPTSAWLTASPNPVTITLPVGGSTSLPLILSNTGTLSSTFTLQPAASALTSGSTMAGPFPYREVPSNDPTTPQSEAVGGETPQANLAPVASGGIQGGEPRKFGVTTPFPGTAGFRSAAASCNGETFYVFGGQTGSTSVDEVWMYDPADNAWSAKAPMPEAASNMRAACIDGKIYLGGGYAGGSWKNTFQIYDTRTNSWTSTTQPMTGAPMLAAYNGLLYAMGGATGSGPSNLARVYNPATGIWTPLANLPIAASYSGAVVYKNFIFIIGGIETADVQRYNPVSNTWDNSGPNLPSPRMDPIVGWYGDQIYLLNGGGNGGTWQPYPEGYVLNASAWPGGSWTPISPTLPKPKVAPASICAGNRLWSIGGTINTYEEPITQYYDNGLMCNRTYPPVPWLTATPQSGTVPLAGQATVTLGFNANAAPYNTPGVYHAVLKFNSDAPSAMSDIPVTMVVVQTSPYLTVTPASDAKPVYPGKYASYNFTITNTSGGPESFVVAALGITSGWTAVLNPASFNDLPNNGTATMNVKMYPPAGAQEGDEGILSLSVRVHDNSSRSASLSMITTFHPYLKTWLPYVAK